MSTEPIDCLGFDHIDLTVNEMGRSTAWYERVLGRLGFDLLKEESASGSVIIMNGITSIAIRPCASEEEQGEEFDRHRVGLHHLALHAARRVRLPIRATGPHRWLAQTELECVRDRGYVSEVVP